MFQLAPKNKKSDLQDLEKKMEILSQGLEDLAEYTKSLWQFLPIAVCNVSPMGFIYDANRAFEGFTLWQTSEISGKPLSTIFSEKEAVNIIDQTLKNKSISNQEVRLTAKNGEKISVVVYSNIREDYKGDSIGFFLAIIDNRELKRSKEVLEKRINERTNELQEKVGELEKFYKLAVNRELKMTELKEEIEKLKAMAGSNN